MSIRAERVYRWKICGKPQCGDTIKVQNREYSVTSTEPHVSHAGKPTTLVRWNGQCTICGHGFEFTTYGRKFEPVATCELHRSLRR
jgi:hypothetical protein